VDPTGIHGPTPGQARGRNWRQSSYGLYVPAAVDPEVPEQRILEQAARLRPGGAVTGWAAGRLLGATFFDGLRTDGRTRLAVPVCPGSGLRLNQNSKCRVSRDRLFDKEIVTRHAIPCAAPMRALFDEMRYAADEREAVVAMDMMAAAELVSIRQMLAYVGSHPGWQGVEQVRRALPLSSEDSRSPNETRMRLIWQVDAGLPRPLVNKPLFALDGRLLGYPDILDVEAGVVGEFDGADHRVAVRHTKDVAREDHFRRAGLEYFTLTGSDVGRRALAADRMLATRKRALFMPVEGRLWTIEPPHWWHPEPTLDEILTERAFTEQLHAEWERESEQDLEQNLGWLLR